MIKTPTNPIRPEDINSNAFPDFVIEAFNNCIKKNYRNGKSKILQDEIVSEICKVAVNYKTPISRADVFHRKYLDVESIYKDAGWIVKHLSPDCNENFPSFFEFIKDWQP